MNFKPFFFVLFVPIFLMQCSRSEPIMLAFDFSSMPLSHYYLDARITGSIASTDTARTFFTTTQCTLHCVNDTGKNQNQQQTTISAIHITSDILGDNEIQNLVKQAHDTRLTCNLQDGIIVPKDSSDIPFMRIGEWNLVKDLIKTIPALPKMKVTKGSTWERERSVPMQMRHGKATGHLLQSFSLDSVYTFNNKKYALVRWIFSYQIDIQSSVIPGILDEIPSKGTGAGIGLINVSNKSLEKASIDFSVASTREGTYKIDWKENISLTAVHGI